MAIQDAMGWTDNHLHEFRFKPKGEQRPVSIGIPSEDDLIYDAPYESPVLAMLDPRQRAIVMQQMEAPVRLAGWEVPVARYLTLEQRKLGYDYDFGDGWEHTVRLESIGSLEKGMDLPQCIGGRRACPPEDCGGTPGYARLLKILADPDHGRHAELSEWVGGTIDPEAFNPRDVTFTDPHRRLDQAFDWM